MNLIHWRHAAIVAVLITSSATLYAANGDEYKEASTFYKQGQMGPALERVNTHLSSKPKDAQGRFLKGLILTEQKKPSEAIAVFTTLTEDYPELPEPYNNLAVLYASQGQYDKAKTALELAIHTHPSYATAHENLGDIYTQLASRAYDKALQLDKTNTTAQNKLAMIKDLFGGRPSSAGAPTKVAIAPVQPPAPTKAPEVKPEPQKPVVVATPAPAPIATPVPAPIKPVITPPPVVVATAPVAPVVVPPISTGKPTTPPTANGRIVTETKPTSAPVAVIAPPAPPPVAAKPADDSADDVVSSVMAWSKAWSNQSVDEYIGHYSPSFEPGSGQSRQEWEAARRDRIQKPSFIEVNISDAKVTVIDANTAMVSFRQSYKSNTLKSQNTKTMRMVKSGGKWLIAKELAGGQ
jgi:Flp pilus assembly protein TadD